MSNNTPKKTILIVAALSTFLVAFMGSSVNIALPAISSELQVDAVLVTWIPTAYLLATAVCLLPFGRLADIYGRKRILTYGIFVFTIAALLLSFVSSVGSLIALRVVQGAGSAMIATSGVAIITSVFPARERGKALGISVATTYLGLSLGPVLGRCHYIFRAFPGSGSGWHFNPAFWLEKHIHGYRAPGRCCHFPRFTQDEGGVG